jgi:hypothetical protein
LPFLDGDFSKALRTIDSVRRQLYPSWDLCIAVAEAKGDGPSDLHRLADAEPRIQVVPCSPGQGEAAASNQALAQATGAYLGLLASGDELAPHALFELARVLQQRPDADLVYTDHDWLDDAGRRCRPVFKPDWSPDLLRSRCYLTPLCLLRASLFRELGLRPDYEGSHEYDLLLRACERGASVHHVAKVLYHCGTSRAPEDRHASGAKAALEDHLARCGTSAQVLPGHAPETWRIKYPIDADPLVTIIICSAKAPLLEECVRGILARTAYRNFELVLVDNSKSGLIHKCFERITRCWPASRILDCRGFPFNYSYLNNLAAEGSVAPYLLFLNDDTSPINSDWLEALLEHGQRREVGGVGAQLLYADDTLQHCGIVMGLDGPCSHGFARLPLTDDGYESWPHLIRNCSAVTGACLLTRRDIFQEVGGFDETHFPVGFQDVDLCLKIRARGYDIVYTPYARLHHFEAFSKAANLKFASALESANLLDKWSEVIRADPFYNPNLLRCPAGPMRRTAA